MEKVKKSLQCILLLLVLGCNDTKEKEYPKILETILNQYPMYVNISPSGDKILLKNRGKETFDLLISDLITSRIDTIDHSDFTQLSLTWHPNGEKIIFQEFNINTRKYDLYKIELSSKKRSLIELPASRSAIPPLRWSKNGSYLAYLATNRISTLYIYDNNKIINSFSNINIYSDFQWLDNSTILFIKNPKKPILNKINIHTNEIEEYVLMENGIVEKDFLIRENKVLYLGREHNEKYFQCYELNMDKQNIRKITFGNFNISNCKYSNDGSLIYYNQNEKGMNRLYCSDYLVNNAFPNLSNEDGVLNIDLEQNNDLYVANKTFQFPSNLLKLNKESLKLEVVYEPPNAEELKLKKPDFVEIERENTPYKIPSYFWKVNGGNLGKKTVIYVHGGPHIQIKPIWNIRAKLFTKNGFNVLSINYHGSTGYSKYFSDKISESNQILDVISSVNFLKEKYDIDQKDIILIGMSYGGKLVLKASDYLSNIGGVVLISGVINYEIKNIDRLKKIKLYGFYGDLDPLTLQAYNFFKRNDLIKSKPNNFQIFKNEGHIFHGSSSWSKVYGTIIELYSK